MKAETQIGLAVVIFFAGFVAGQSLIANESLPTWISALSDVALAAAAVYGVHRAFSEWQRQFTARRDHDLAIGMTRAINDCHTRTDELRTPFGMVTDGDVPVPPSEFSNPDHDRQYRVAWARYRSRQMHLHVAAEQRHAKQTEAMAIWGKDGDSIGELINQINDKERDVLFEAHKHVAHLNPGLDNLGPPDLDVLYAPAEASAHDQFANDYEALMRQVSDLLKPKIQISE
jgi:hypothetical protein